MQWVRTYTLLGPAWGFLWLVLINCFKLLPYSTNIDTLVVKSNILNTYISYVNTLHRWLTDEGIDIQRNMSLWSLTKLLYARYTSPNMLLSSVDSSVATNKLAQPSYDEGYINSWFTIDTIQPRPYHPIAKGSVLPNLTINKYTNTYQPSIQSNFSVRGLRCESANYSYT